MAASWCNSITRGELVKVNCTSHAGGAFQLASTGETSRLFTTGFRGAPLTGTIAADAPHNNGAGWSSVTPRSASGKSGEGALSFPFAPGALNRFTSPAHRQKLLKAGVTFGAVILVESHCLSRLFYHWPKLKSTTSSFSKLALHADCQRFESSTAYCVFPGIMIRV